MKADAPLRVGIRCGAGRIVGIGHVIRCLALAEEVLRPRMGWADPPL